MRNEKTAFLYQDWVFVRTAEERKIRQVFSYSDIPRAASSTVFISTRQSQVASYKLTFFYPTPSEGGGRRNGSKVMSWDNRAS